MQKNVKFLMKWEKLASEKKPFKPAQKSLTYYSIETAELSHEEIKKMLDIKEKQL